MLPVVYESAHYKRDHCESSRNNGEILCLRGFSCVFGITDRVEGQVSVTIERERKKQSEGKEMTIR